MKQQKPTIAILWLLSIVLTGCGNSSSKDEAPLAVGSVGPGGGIIFAFFDDTMTRGLEVFTAAIGQSEWGCIGVKVDDGVIASNGVGAPAGAISSGLLRTASESGICMPDAAELTFGFTNNDLNDWYLPSTDELITLRNLGLLPSEPGSAYWSSTENTDQNAFIVLLRMPANPSDTGEPSTSNKATVASVIPIRTFQIN